MRDGDQVGGGFDFASSGCYEISLLDYPLPVSPSHGKILMSILFQCTGSTFDTIFSFLEPEVDFTNILIPYPLIVRKLPIFDGVVESPIFSGQNCLPLAELTA